MGAISIADLDGDGDLEIVVTNNDWITFDERIWLLKGIDGTVDWSYATSYSSFRGCAIGDINGNDTLDLVAGYFMGDIIAVEPYTGLLWQMNSGTYLPTGLPYYESDHGPLIADFDQNGKMDVFIVAGYGTYTPDSQNVGKAFMIEAGTGTCPEWLSFRRDAHRSGFLDRNITDTLCNPVTGVQQEYSSTDKIMVYPNPASESIRLKGIQTASLTLLDLQGRTLKQQTIHESEKFSLQEFTPGLYLLQVNTGSENQIFKIFVE